VLTTKVPFKNRGGIVIGTVGINRDVTSIKEADERLRAANADLQKAHQELRDTQLQLIEVEKFQVAGRVAAGVAHQVKNPLAVALRGIEFLSALPLVSGDATARIVLQDMNDAIRRAEGVIRGMQDFAAPRRIAAEPQDVNELLEQVLLLMKPELEKQELVIDRDLAESLPPCRLDAHKTQGVFFNVIENAVHAMPDGGTLTIRTSQQIITGIGTNIGDRRGYQFGTGDNVIVIEILDTGPGIPEDKLQKIFDPFFTTKPTGVGIGLGLSVAKTTVELEGGTIEISNRSEGGAKVTIVFPSDSGEKWTQKTKDPLQSF
jgi:signal transduction histidine kinase